MRLVRRRLLIALTIRLTAVAAQSVAQVPSRGDISAGYEAAGVTGECRLRHVDRWGLDVRVSERIRIRTGLDYLWTPADDGGSAWRFGLGGVVAF